METAAVAALGIIIGTMNGDTREAPFSLRTRTCSNTVCSPPIPLVTTQPASGSGPSRPLIFHAGTKLDEQGRVVTNGGRVLNVTTLGHDMQEAMVLAYSAVSSLDFEGMTYRHDIGRNAV